MFDIFFRKSCRLWDKVRKTWYSRTGHRWQYDTCPLYAGYQRLQTHTQNMQYLLLCTTLVATTPSLLRHITSPGLFQIQPSVTKVQSQACDWLSHIQKIMWVLRPNYCYDCTIKVICNKTNSKSTIISLPQYLHTEKVQLTDWRL
jgi:hypothetical protein